MSTTLGKLQASLASVSNEVTVAAANINFDFSLVKCEAPKEFQPLGHLLASTRKRDAETGETHITARRLGALFSGICAETPKLSEAYGARVAEISKAATAKEPPEYKKSIFAAYAGVDGTSIWAAATSSKTSIQVHLLACMLAELWEPAEAVSIWEEIVVERRRDIANRLDRGEELNFALAAAAAQQGIPRDKLALWDSSARSWIQTAKSVKAKEHKQFELIVKNIDLYVNDKTDLLIGVIEAWKLALDTMEKLIGGEPCEIREGAVLLAISAWHIYPDMHVFGNQNLEIRMKDPLVAEGGIVSIGCRPSLSSSGGVHWSLCLNYLNSYGPPIRKHGNLRNDERFISIQNLSHAAIGAIFTKWQVESSDTKIALEVLAEVYSLFSRTFLASRTAMQTMRTAVLECLHDEGNALDFLSYGRRRPQFLDPSSHDEKYMFGTSTSHEAKHFFEPFFGLLKPQVLLECLSRSRVELLMRCAKDKNPKGCEAVIYDVSTGNAYRLTRQVGPVDNDTAELDWTRVSLAYPTQGSKRKRSGFHLRNSQLVCCLDGESDQVLDFWFGDIGTAAIFIDQPWRRSEPTPEAPRIMLQDVLWCLNSSNFLVKGLAPTLSEAEPTIQAAFHLTEAIKTFSSIPQVKVHIQSLERPLLDQPWVRMRKDLLGIEEVGPYDQSSGIDDLAMFRKDMENTIRMIANLVAGLDIYHVPERAVGISTGDSLIVPLALLRDPATHTAYKFTRILGNLGQPGFVVFSLPETPILAPLDEAHWRIHNTPQFDGRSEDMLGSTSLHLSFTDWSQPLQIRDRVGARDIGGKLMESVISIRDKARWIGDVDPLGALNHEIVFRLPEQTPCDHERHSRPVKIMTALECWDELMDCPLGELVVVKAHGNWVARLAATAYLVQCAKRDNFTKIKRITICPHRMCWACVNPQFLPNIYID